MSWIYFDQNQKYNEVTAYSLLTQKVDLMDLKLLLTFQVDKG